MEDQITEEIPGQQEAEAAEQAKNKTASCSFSCNASDVSPGSGRKGGGYSGGKHGTYRAGNCRWKKNAGESHAREHSVCAQRLRRTAAKQSERGGNGCCFNALKESDSCAISSQWSR